MNRLLTEDVTPSHKVPRVVLSTVMNYIAHDHKAEVGRKYNGCLNLRLTRAHVEGRE